MFTLWLPIGYHIGYIIGLSKNIKTKKALKIPTYSIVANMGILAIFSLCPPVIIDFRL